MDCNVLVIDLFPGIKEDVVQHMLHTPGIKAVVLKTFGAGNGPSDPWFIDAIRDTVQRGIVVVNITQCTNGSVHPYRYMTGMELAQCGVVSGHDLTSEAAITKLMYLLGRGMNAEEIKNYMEYSLRGEITS